jgi:GT2 family glycosyltransferase
MTTNISALAVSVVIPTHNPRMDYLRRVLEALRGQTLAKDLWELVVVDNGSRVPLKAAAGPRDREQESGVSPKTSIVDLSWHGNARIVREEELGLTFARLRGFAEAKGELIVMVDDDNLLAPDYIETAVRIAQEHPGLGAFGGKCLPEFETKPDPWLEARGKGLGLRDRGEREEFFPEELGSRLKDQETNRLRDSRAERDRLECNDSHAAGSLESEINIESKSGKVERWEPDDGQPTTANLQRRVVTEFPDCAPIGAGMVLRSAAARAYAERLDQKTKSLRDKKTKSPRDEEPSGARQREAPPRANQELITDRKGDSLASGGDNDICLTVIEEGWQVGYLPELKLTHLIPKGRMTLDYHKRMARDSMKSFILMLDQHGIRPWPAMAKWTLPLRVASDWRRVKPWRGPKESLRFWGHVGMYEGRAALPRGGGNRCFSASVDSVSLNRKRQ